MSTTKNTHQPQHGNAAEQRSHVAADNEGRLPLRWGIILPAAAFTSGTVGMAAGVGAGLMTDPVLGIAAGIATGITTFSGAAYRLHRMLALR
ncbi:hypothetical protein [Streptomyces sp. NPDC002082]|uniref:hypothetical protein n=1 Tax=Streptomyces sp. NPDC002082 TaxID=3154772 RepID=UPI0033213942